MSIQFGKLSNSQGSVQGRYGTYSLHTVPHWHAAANANMACGRVVQTLDVTLTLAEPTDFAAARRTVTCIVAAGDVDVALDDLKFRGRALSAHWQSSMDHEGSVRAASLSLQIEGQES